VFIDENILCIVSIMLKMLCVSIEHRIKVSIFPYSNKAYFHDIISVHKTNLDFTSANKKRQLSGGN